MSMLISQVVIGVTKEGVKFEVHGDMGKGTVTLRPNTSVDKEEDQVCLSSSTGILM